MLFHYKALTKSGEEITDTVDAPGEAAAIQKIRNDGNFVISIKAADLAGKKTSSFSIRKVRDYLYDFINKSSAKKQVGLFSRQLSTLIRAGMPLVTALNDIIEQIDNKAFKNIIIDIREKIEEGTSFSNAIARHRDIFSEMYISMIRVGENLGSLDEVIERMSEMEEKKVFLKNRIRAALWYPSFMLAFSSIIVVFLMVNIIPTITGIFVDQQRELPLPTKIVVAMSDFLTSFWGFIPLFVIFFIYIYSKYAATDKGRKKIDELKMKIPIASRLYNKVLVYRFTLNLGVLVSNRVDLLKSFEIVKKIVDNVIVEKKIEEAAKNIQEGVSISQALKKHDFLPRLVTGMIAAGEASDKVDEMLLNIGKVYENEIDMTVTSITGMIEPVIIIVMGFLIGVIVLSVMMPIMEMNLLVN
ncbi:MAG: type II secretion system F family protein [Spirochaetota bacterium]